MKDENNCFLMGDSPNRDKCVGFDRRPEGPTRQMPRALPWANEIVY